MFVHVTFWTGLIASIVGLVVTTIFGFTCFGLVKSQLLSTLKSTIEVQGKELDSVRIQLRELKDKFGRLERDTQYKSQQLAMALRMIEFFERMVIVYAKARSGLPARFVTEMDNTIKKLAEYRERASLDLEDQEISQEFYDSLIRREILQGANKLSDWREHPEHIFQTEEKPTE